MADGSALGGTGGASGNVVGVSTSDAVADTAAPGNAAGGAMMNVANNVDATQGIALGAGAQTNNNGLSEKLFGTNIQNYMTVYA